MTVPVGVRRKVVGRAVRAADDHKVAAEVDGGEAIVVERVHDRAAVNVVPAAVIRCGVEPGVVVGGPCEEASCDRVTEPLQ